MNGRRKKHSRPCYFCHRPGRTKWLTHTQDDKEGFITYACRRHDSTMTSVMPLAGYRIKMRHARSMTHRIGEMMHPAPSKITFEPKFSQSSKLASQAEFFIAQ